MIYVSVIDVLCSGKQRHMQQTLFLDKNLCNCNCNLITVYVCNVFCDGTWFARNISRGKVCDNPCLQRVSGGSNVGFLKPLWVLFREAPL